jgi:hypothetical protein
MRRQRLIFILAIVTVVIAYFTNVLGNVLANQSPAFLKDHAPLLFLCALGVEMIMTAILSALEKRERTLLNTVLALFLIVVLAGAGATSGVESNFVPAALDEPFRSGVEQHVVPLLIILTLIDILATGLVYHLTAQIRESAAMRTDLLRQLGARYHARLREQLGESARVALGLRENTQAVTQPALARQEVGAGLGEERAWPAGTPIGTVFDEAHEELLILGEPGAGKSTFLVELAEELTQRATRSVQLKIPIVFSLASWAIKQLTLEAWMAEELVAIYHLRSRRAAALMDADAVLPLLDGLDEVAEEHRVACAQAIDHYHRDHSLVPLAVCSRSAEYLALSTHLHLQTAAVVQPLDYEEQIKPYLARGQGLEGLQAALEADAELRSAASTPLMLSVMVLAYQGRAGNAIPLPRAGDMVAWRRRLWDDYVPRMYQRRRGRSELVERGERADRRRGWWARGRVAKSAYTLDQTMYYLAWLAAQLKAHDQRDFLLERIQWDWLSDEEAQEHQSIALKSRARWSWSEVDDVVSQGLGCGLRTGLLYGLVGGLIIGLIAGLSDGPVTGLSVGLVVLVLAVIQWLGIGLIGGLVLGLGSGADPQPVVEHKLGRPGEGVRSSRWNGLVGGLFYQVLAVVGVELFLGLLYVLKGGREIGLGDVLIWGLVAGTVGFTWGWSKFGGEDYDEHQKVLRQLEQAGVVPKHYVRFLDFAAEHILLRRYYGSYRFIHDLLLDYFAEHWAESGGTLPAAGLAVQAPHETSS